MCLWAEFSCYCAGVEHDEYWCEDRIERTGPPEPWCSRDSPLFYMFCISGFKNLNKFSHCYRVLLQKKLFFSPVLSSAPRWGWVGAVVPVGGLAGLHAWMGSSGCLWLLSSTCVPQVQGSGFIGPHTLLWRNLQEFLRENFHWAAVTTKHNLYKLCTFQWC